MPAPAAELNFAIPHTLVRREAAIAAMGALVSTAGDELEEELATVLPLADFVVLAIPGTAETDKLIGAASHGP